MRKLEMQQAAEKEDFERKVSNWQCLALIYSRKRKEKQGTMSVDLFQCLKFNNFNENISQVTVCIDLRQIVGFYRVSTNSGFYEEN